MLAQHLPQALNIHVDEETAVSTAMKADIVAHPNTAKDVEAMSVVQTDAEAIVKALEVI